MLSVRHCKAQQLETAYAQCLVSLLACLERFSLSLNAFSSHVPHLEQVNPPLWEFGHVAWFTEHWVLRNPGRALGRGLKDPNLRASMRPSLLPEADALFDSATIPHGDRWQLEQLGRSGIEHYLSRTFKEAIAILQLDATREKALYFHRLSIAHTWMHLEALEMTAQTLGFERTESAEPMTLDVRDQAPLAIDAQALRASPDRDCFFFDNEFGGLEADIGAFEIDAQPVSLGAFWAFVDDGGYERESLWTDHGWAWKTRQAAAGPLHSRRQSDLLLCRVGAQWALGDAAQPVCHVCLHEAQAWCNWAGRQLPTEAQWMAAASAGMRWGRVWEWTSSPFVPFSGFTAHPYEAYSEPWFGADHWVLKGACAQTHPMLRDRLFRNFYRPHRQDVFAGFRSVQAAVAGCATNSTKPPERLR
jgi:gamma-glutamyl hercynylcysteine S-oxide synthase